MRMKRHLDTEIIYDKNGKPIPQYLDVNDKSGGTDGTMKPITGDNGAQNIQLTGSRVELETVINAQSVVAGGRAEKTITTAGESELWFLTTIDQQPWTLTAGNPWYSNAGWGSSSLFPNRDMVSKTTTMQVPNISLYMPMSPAASVGFTAPTTIQEARAFPLSPPRTLEVGVRNRSEETAVVTLRVLRIWRLK